MNNISIDGCIYNNERFEKKTDVLNNERMISLLIFLLIYYKKVV